jgi:hypothetical protein
VKKFPYPESVNINKAMRSLEGWQEVGQRRFKKYGRQKGYERVSG